MLMRQLSHLLAMAQFHRRQQRKAQQPELKAKNHNPCCFLGTMFCLSLVRCRTISTCFSRCNRISFFRTSNTSEKSAEPTLLVGTLRLRAHESQHATLHAKQDPMLLIACFLCFLCLLTFLMLHLIFDKRLRNQVSIFHCLFLKHLLKTR